MTAPDATQDGELYAARQKIYPREISGRFQRLRVVAVWVLLGIYYVLPWIPWGGRQAVLFFLNEALAAGVIKVADFKGQSAIVGYYPGDTFHGVKHEEKIDSGDWILIPLNEPVSRLDFDGKTLSVQSTWDAHPMTMVTWFGARAYCEYYGGRLPTELEWEKAARGTDERPFPWGDTIERNNANFYASRDPFEDMSSYGSRTTPIGFYNGQTYEGYVTLDSASPYGLYAMAGNVWQVWQ